MVIDGVEVIVSGFTDITEDEIRKYVAYVRSKAEYPVKELTISLAYGNNVNLGYVEIKPKFERVRRITGYLVGTIDRWNNSKKAEEHDRVKHTA